MKYRKKPIVIDAVQWDGSQESLLALREMAPEAYLYSRVSSSGCLSFETLEGPMSYPLGYWIIRGVAGEVYGCHSKIFAATYTLV